MNQETCPSGVCVPEFASQTQAVGPEPTAWTDFETASGFTDPAGSTGDNAGQSEYTPFNLAAQNIFEVNTGSDQAEGDGILTSLRNLDTLLRGRDLGPMRTRMARTAVYYALGETSLILDRVDTKVEDFLFEPKGEPAGKSALRKPFSHVRGLAGKLRRTETPVIREETENEDRVKRMKMHLRQAVKRAVEVVSDGNKPEEPEKKNLFSNVTYALKDKVFRARREVTHSRVQSAASTVAEMVLDWTISQGTNIAVAKATGVEGTKYVSPASELVAQVANLSKGNRDNVNGVSVESAWRTLYQAPILGVPVEKAYDWANEQLDGIDKSKGKSFLKKLILGAAKGAARGAGPVPA